MVREWEEERATERATWIEEATLLIGSSFRDAFSLSAHPSFPSDFSDI